MEDGPARGAIFAVLLMLVVIIWVIGYKLDEAHEQLQEDINNIESSIATPTTTEPATP